MTNKLKVFIGKEPKTSKSVCSEEIRQYDP